MSSSGNMAYKDRQWYVKMDLSSLNRAATKPVSFFKYPSNYISPYQNQPRGRKGSL